MTTGCELLRDFRLCWGCLTPFERGEEPAWWKPLPPESGLCRMECCWRCRETWGTTVTTIRLGDWLEWRLRGHLARMGAR